MSISAEGKGEEKTEWVYCGTWYKPWTWFSWREVTYIKDFKLISFWAITEDNKE